jgi:hypothetical protein
MLVYVFPVLLPIGLAALAYLCIRARRLMNQAADTSDGRAALLLAMTRMPIAPKVPGRGERSEQDQGG